MMSTWRYPNRMSLLYCPIFLDAGLSLYAHLKAQDDALSLEAGYTANDDSNLKSPL
jgi:hypothetical protein